MEHLNLIFAHGGSYIIAHMRDPATNSHLFAHYRDVSKDGIENYTMDEPTGPWTNADGTLDPAQNGLLDRFSGEAMRLLRGLNGEVRPVPAMWRGKFDRKPTRGRNEVDSVT